MRITDNFQLFAALGIWSLRCVQVCCGQVDTNVSEPIPPGGDAVSPYDWTIPATPWFADPGVRSQLELDDQKYRQLEMKYQEAVERYQRQLMKIDPTLAEAERLRQEAKLRRDFDIAMTRSTHAVIADPTIRKRYNQLYWQHRGIGAYDDDDDQSRISLNPAQQQKIRHLNRDWNDRMRQWNREYRANPDEVLKRYNQGRTEFNEGLRSILDARQLERWNDLTGAPYDFPPEVYFGTVVRPGLR